MKTLNRSQQKVLKTLHLITASIWMACVVVLALLPIISHNIKSGDELYMYNLMYYFIDIKILTPAATVTLITGLIFSIFTKWGFFKHGWLIYKWVVTLGIVLIGTFYLGPMVTKMLTLVDSKRIAVLEDAYYLSGETIGLCAAIFFTVLLIGAIVVSIYKPWKNIKK